MPSDLKSGKSGSTRAAEIRSRLKHPVIDADAHAIEFGPAYLDFLKQVAGLKVTDRFLTALEVGGWYGLTPQQRLDRRVARPSVWTMPTRNAVDRATAMMPRLFRARMDDFGLDFSIVYSTLALFVARLKAMFSSDIGHWDVPDMIRVLEEAYELVEWELLDDDDFRDFVFAHAATLHGGMNPDFFKGTVVENEVFKLLK